MAEKKKLLIALLCLASALGLLAGVWWQQHQQQEEARYKENLAATVLSAPRALPPFKLVNEEGKSFSNKDLQGQWSLLFFGFTHCPNVCPVTMGQLKQFYQLLSQASVVKPAVFLISIDPERDTPQRVREYVKTFNPNFHGATGDPKSIARLTQALGIVNMKMAPNGTSKKQAAYGISHSDALVLINPRGQVHAFFSSPHKPESILNDYKVIVEHDRG